MHYLLVSFSHHNTTIVTREQIAFGDDEAVVKALKELTSYKHILETVIVNTCNRVEFFVSTISPKEATKTLFMFLSNHSKLSINELKERADTFEDQSAIHHLFSVTSSLDSLVIGETQIAGQIKDAYRLSSKNGFCGKELDFAIQGAFKCAAEVRNSTNISKNPVSVASVAIIKAKEELGELNGRFGLVIGVGEMSQIAAKHMVKAGMYVSITNRTMSRAYDVVESISEPLAVVDFNQLEVYINDFDILFTSTGSATPIVTNSMLKERDSRRYWFDMAIPKDIDIGKSDGLSLYRVDDLHDIVTNNVSLREEEAKLSYRIVNQRTIEFYRWLQRLSVEPIIKNIYSRAQMAAKDEVERVVNRGFLPKEHEEQLRKAAYQSMKRFLHSITTQIRTVSDEDNAENIIYAIRYLLETEDKKQEN